jgi:hypothetical protein
MNKLRPDQLSQFTRLSRLARISRRQAQSGQAFVEFAMVLILIITILVGGILVIRALFMQQSLLDVAARAIQWGSATNSNEEMQRIINDARSFAPDLSVTIDPPDAAQRPIGTLLTLTLRANVPLVGPFVSLNAPLSARVAAVIQHNPMRFVEPSLPPISLQAGDYARVFTTAGDNLNVRRKPGLDGDVAFILHPNTQVQVIGGPVDANGLRWYKVYLLHSKLTGWCVGRADQVNTLVKIGKVF